VTRNRIYTFLTSRSHRSQGTGDSATNRLLEEKPAPSDGSEEWELEYQRRLASLAMERVRHEFHESSWRSFWLTAVEGVAPAEAARQIGISAGAVYVAKSRVLARIKSEVETMQRQEES
jgi:RNA polymerase sigma-70 factor (ECF subfamily)